MPKDLNYVGGGPYPALRLTTDDNTPEILKRAITLMLFSHDSEIRNFNGESVVAAFPKIPTAGFSGIYFHLTLAAKRIYELLKPDYADLKSVYFSADESGSSLQVNLNVELNDNNTESIMVYE